MNIDKIGIATSLLCLIHCLALPVLSTLIYEGVIITEAHGHNHTGWLSLSIDVVFLCVAVYAVVISSKKSSSRLLKSVLATGILLFVCGMFLRHEMGLDIFLHLGSLSLIVGHLGIFFTTTKAKCEIASP